MNSYVKSVADVLEGNDVVEFAAPYKVYYGDWLPDSNEVISKIERTGADFARLTLIKPDTGATMRIGGIGYDRLLMVMP